jgi:hypothetical protein
MKDQKARPNFATVRYDVREKLGIEWTEYIYLDMVKSLSYHGWCYKSLDSCATDLGMTKRGVSKMKERLLERGLLRRNIRGHLKVTEKYTGVAVNSVPQALHVGGELSSKSVNSVPKIGELSSTKNNKRITLDIENGDGYKKARSMRDQLARRLSA